MKNNLLFKHMISFVKFINKNIEDIDKFWNQEEIENIKNNLTKIQYYIC